MAAHAYGIAGKGKNLRLGFLALGRNLDPAMQCRMAPLSMLLSEIWQASWTASRKEYHLSTADIAKAIHCAWHSRKPVDVPIYKAVELIKELNGDKTPEWYQPLN